MTGEVVKACPTYKNTIMLLRTLFEESDSIDDDELRLRLTLIKKVLHSLGSENPFDIDAMMDFYHTHGSAFASVTLAKAMVTVNEKRSGTHVIMMIGFDGDRWTLVVPDVERLFIGAGQDLKHIYFDIDDEPALLAAMRSKAAEVKDKMKKFKPETDVEKKANFKVVDWYKKK